MKQLNPENNHRVIREITDMQYTAVWLRESLEENREQMELTSDMDEVKRLQGENRAIRIMLDKISDK